MERPDLRRAIENLPPDRRALLERRLLEGHARSTAEAIVSRSGDGPWPLSFAQQRLWLIHQIEPQSAAYNVPRALRYSGSLDVDAFRRALDLIVERHETLRTTFEVRDGLPVQVVGAARPVPLPVLDLSADPAATADQARLEAILRDEARRPFDLAADLMLRALLVRLGPHEHVVALTMHHIASDAWSARLLSGELTTAYAAFASGTAPALAPLPIQYADYAVWQRGRLADSALDEPLDYWRRRLDGAEPLDLPTDRPRPPVQSHQGARRARLLPERLAAAARAFSRQEGVTLFMTLLASWLALLHRYSGQDDVSVGSVIAGRTRTATESLIGFFVNALVMRGDCSGDPPFRELLARTRAMALGAFAHQDLPFERLVEALRPPRSLAHAPLIQVMFVLQDGERPVTALPGLEVTPVPVDAGAAPFDLSLSVSEMGAALHARADFATDLFEASTIDRMLGHWESLLEGALADPTRRLSELPLLGEAERQLIARWTRADRRDQADDRAVETTLTAVLERQAARTPEAPAVTCDGVTLTYRELNQRANRLARHLRAGHVTRSSRVGVCVERSLDLVIAILGVLKVGAAYVPLDPTYPRARLVFMLEDAGAAAVVTHAGFLHHSGVPEVRLDRDAEAISQQSSDDLPGAGAPGDLAHVIYTSGSTGTPKGVETTHANLVRLFGAAATDFSLGAGDVWTLFHSVAFDFSVWELWGALLHGARLVVVPHLVTRSPDAFRELVRSEGVTVLSQTPSAFQSFMRADATAGGDGLALRLVVIGGEALDFASLRPWVERHGDVSPALVNIYGPTETTVYVTSHRMTAEEIRAPRGSIIGRPLPDLSVLVLDRHRLPVPIGVPGELFVGGPGLARGYLGRPDLTAERFGPDPFSTVPGKRLYRTGDRVRFRADGAIEFLGRFDDQVKIRGYRIELGEVEAACLAHPAVREAVATVREDAQGDRRLVTYIVAADGPPPDRAALRAFLRERLPEHMLPAAVVHLPHLPLTTNGKVNRRALPSPEPTARTTAPIPAMDPLEHQLVEIWEALLDVRPVGVRDDFFALGGHSLLAVRMMDAVARTCGRRLPLSTLFEEATVEHIARAIKRAEADAFRSPVRAFHAEGRRCPLFFLHGDFNGGGFYVRELARQLGPDRPFYAIHPHGLDGGPIPESIEAMARDHLGVVQSISPHGPYLLGGACNGGLIAFEMARQLVRRGETVNLVAIVDARAWNRRFRLLRVTLDGIGALTGASRARRDERFLALRAQALLLEARAKRYQRRVVGLRPAARLAALTGASLAVVASVRDALRRGRPVATEASGIPGVASALERYTRAVNAYMPGRYRGRVAVLAAADRPREYGDLGWGRVADDVEVHRIPGDHFTTLTRHTHALGARLRDCVEAVEMP